MDQINRLDNSMFVPRAMSRLLLGRRGYVYACLST